MPGRLRIPGGLVQRAELGVRRELAGDVAVPVEGDQRRHDLGQFGEPVAVLGGQLGETELPPRPYRRFRVGGARIVQ